MISVITGGISGIGKVIATTLRSRGDEIYTTSRRKIADTHHISIDLTTRKGIMQICEEFRGMFIDNLIFTHRYRGESWSADYQLTLKSVDNLIHGLENSLGVGTSIIILGSKASNLIFSEQSLSYHLTRGALESMTRYYAVNLGRKGIRCNCVIPGFVMKPENEEFWQDASNPMRTMIEEITPLGRMSRSEDVAQLVRFLCSQEAQNITGQCIVIDGGLSLVAQENIGRQRLLQDGNN